MEILKNPGFLNTKLRIDTRLIRPVEVPIPEYVDLSPQIMIEEFTNSLVHEKNLKLIDFSYYNACDTPHYLPLLSSVSYKEECEFEDIREEDEEESGGRRLPPHVHVPRTILFSAVREHL